MLDHAFVCESGEMRKTRHRHGAPIKLADFALERRVEADDPDWRIIGVWQRRGLITLRWGDSKSYAYVRLTARGTEEAAKGTVILA